MTPSPVVSPAPASHDVSRDYAAGHDALQALLAFSALHEQVRHRRLLQNQEDGSGSSQTSGEIEEFALDEVLQLVAERALSLTGADGVAIALAEGDAIVCRAVAGTTTPGPGVRLQPNSGFSGACLVSGNIVRCDDSDADLRVSPIVCRQLGVRSMVAVPLSAKNNVIGLIEAFSSEPFGFNDSDVRSLTLLAELMLAALKPEEEDRMAEISRRVVHPEPEPSPEIQAIAAPEVVAEEPEYQSEVEASATAPEPVLSDPTADRSRRPGLAVVFTLIAFAAVLGAGLWWTIRHRGNAQTSASIQPVPTSPSLQLTPAQSNSVAVTNEPRAIPDEEIATPESTPPSGNLAIVSGVRHWSAPDTSTVVIDLEDQVQYEAHRLTNPDRIYFDLHDTRLAATFMSHNIDVGDPLLQRVRVAQPTPGITRVVLETKGSSNFSVSLEPNPYRLVVELRKIGTKPQARTKIDLFGPLSSPETASAPSATQPVVTATGKLRIVLDAGHGGWDLGTVGRKGLLEKDLVLDIVARMGKLVEDRLHAEVIYTRKDDSYITLEKRAEMANLAKANLFLSVHANYSDYPSARGVETYFSNTYSSIKARSPEDQGEPAIQNVDWTNVDIREKVHESRRLAIDIQHALYGTLAAKNPDLPNRGVKEAQYVVLTGTSMPSILAEISFVSSPTDENNLQSSSYRQRIAEALYQGLARYAATTGQVTVAGVPRKSPAR